MSYDRYAESLETAAEIELGLAEVVGDELWSASPETIEEWLAPVVHSLTEAEAESLGRAFRDLGRWATSKQVRQIATGALPAIGTAVGAVYGGPVGAALGAKVGQVAGQAVSGGGGAGKARASTPPSGGSGAKPGPARGGSQAAGQLIHLVQNPAFISALLALVLGASGKSPQVGAGKASVPPGALMNLLGTLAARAAQDSEDLMQDMNDDLPAYLRDAEGEAVCDITIPSQRADALLRLVGSDQESLYSGGDVEIFSAMEW